MKKISLLFALFLVGIFSLNAQTFTKITDADNALAQHGISSSYTGVSWVDFNDDGLLDCFINPGSLYKNEGNGQFSAVSFSGASTGLGNGNTWGDADNDGDLDLMIAASPCKYFQNNGDETFTASTGMPGWESSYNGWSAAWGDYDNDGWIDLLITHPTGFLGAAQTNRLLHNNGDGTFTNVTDTEVTEEQAAFTIGSFIDFDRDGDQDIFIGSGEVSFLSTDHLYENLLSQIGQPNFQKITDIPLSDDLHDGQNWNFIDYDNDGDLDAFLTNYNGGKTNDLYRNDAGEYVLMTEAEAGLIANQGGAGLTNVWADFDNDGFLDCFVGFDGNQKDYYHHNNGDGTFTAVETPFTINGSTRGAAAGDYDNDGFLDLMISGSAANVGLYHNEGNTNNWAAFTLNTTQSNKAAIGAKVWLKSMIAGISTWQYREINAQNSFNGHNSFVAHFGLGTGNIIDSLMVQWPSGQEDIFTNISEINTYCEITEGGELACSGGVAVQEIAPPIGQISIQYPDTNEVFVRYDFPKNDKVELQVWDMTGKAMEGLSQRQEGLQKGQFIVPISNLPKGAYVARVGQNGAWIAALFVRR